MIGFEDFMMNEYVSRQKNILGGLEFKYTGCASFWRLQPVDLLVDATEKLQEVFFGSDAIAVEESLKFYKSELEMLGRFSVRAREWAKNEAAQGRGDCMYRGLRPEAMSLGSI